MTDNWTLLSVPHDTLQLGLKIGDKDLGVSLLVGRVGEVGASAGLTNWRAEHNSSNLLVKSCCNNSFTSILEWRAMTMVCTTTGLFMGCLDVDSMSVVDSLCENYSSSRSFDWLVRGKQQWIV